jgi:hypothetical protein
MARLHGRIRRVRATTGTLLLVGITAIGLVSCTTVAPLVPQAVVNIPGSYTITTHANLGNPAGTVVLCSTVRTSVLIQANAAFAHPFGDLGDLTWNKAAVSTSDVATIPFDDDFATVAAFGPVDPGCGTFRGALFFDFSGGDPYTGPSSITFSFTKCDPNGTLEDCLATAP